MLDRNGDYFVLLFMGGWVVLNKYHSHVDFFNEFIFVIYIS